MEDRDSDEVLAYCEGKGIAFLPWAPLGSGRHARGSAACGRWQKVAGRHGITVGQATIAWLLGRSRVMLPIPGTGSIEHLEENAAAASVRLTPQDMDDLQLMLRKTRRWSVLDPAPAAAS